MQGSLFDVDSFEVKALTLQNLILPAITLGIRPLAIFTQLTAAVYSMNCSKIILEPLMPEA